MPIAAIFATIGAETVALTAAEVAAAEAAAAAAAEIAAAEAAAATAAEVAAQQAAQQAATQTAAQAATGGAEALNLAAQQQAAQQAGVMGIEGATANAPLTAEAVQSAAMNQGVFPPTDPASYAQLNIGSNPSAPFPEFFGQGQAMPPQGIADPSLAMQPAAQPLNAPMSYDSFGNPAMQGSPAATMADPTGLAQLQQSAIAAPPPSALETGMDKAIKFAEKNPFTAMTGAYLGANALGLMDPSGATFNDDKYDGPLSRYKLSPNFRPGSANPADFQYKPRYAMGGGIMSAMPQQANNIQVGYNESGMSPEVPSYAKGGSLSDSIEKYQKMLEGEKQAAPSKSADVGIYYDQDPDTRYQDALTAAQIRQAKINQRAYVSPPAAKRPTPMGQLQMDSVKAAKGGIMQSSLGGYAAGGNPRLLKGPGDGMSDNIPATINGRQPARLADGEFVIPADVVSHLGNGSTEAGAKQLHAMMNKIRKARTGNPRQGKQIKPSKFLPK